MGKKKKGIKFDSKWVVTYLNAGLLVVNVVIGFFNIPLLKSNLTHSKIQVIKELPMFETQYLSIEKSAFKAIASGNHPVDSLYTDHLKNYYVANNNLQKISFADNDSYGEVITLAIRQIGGSMAKDVTIEYNCINSQDGLDYYVTTGVDVLSLDEYTEDISGNKVTKQTYTVRYGDIPTGRGLILPLFQVCNLRDMQDDSSDSEIYSKTSPVILVPHKLSYKNVYDDEVVTVDIREMNNSIITYSLYLEGRG